jgi:hypothetical protein
MCFGLIAGDPEHRIAVPGAAHAFGGGA